MSALVVYESLWGNTRAVAESIARGIGDGAAAMPTSAATPDLVAHSDLLVVGAPLLGFSLPTDQMRRSIESNPAHAAHKPDLSHQSVREWLEALPKKPLPFAAFETRIWWSPGSSAKSIAKELESAGFLRLCAPHRFVVKGTYGPLREGELELAEAWGRELASLARASAEA